MAGKLSSKTRVKKAIEAQDEDQLAWSLIDWAFDNVCKKPTDRNFHQLLREMSLLKCKNFTNVPGGEVTPNLKETLQEFLEEANKE